MKRAALLGRSMVMLAAAVLVLTAAAIGDGWAGDDGHGLQRPTQSSVYTRWGWPGLSSTVLASDACTRHCAGYCGHGFQACIRADGFNECRDQSDACDLFCLKRCRSYGGPVLNITD